MDRDPMYSACWNLIHMVVQKHIWEWLEQLKGCFCIWEPWTRRTVMILLVGVTNFIQHRPVSSLQLHRAYLFSVCKCSAQGSLQAFLNSQPQKVGWGDAEFIYCAASKSGGQPSACCKRFCQSIYRKSIWMYQNWQASKTYHTGESYKSFCFLVFLVWMLKLGR